MICILILILSYMMLKGSLTDRKRKASKQGRKTCVSFSVEQKCATEIKKQNTKCNREQLNKTFIIENLHNPHPVKINKYTQKEQRLQAEIQKWFNELAAISRQEQKMKQTQKLLTTKMKPTQKHFTTTILTYHTLSSAGYDINQEQKRNQDRIIVLDISSSSSNSFAMAVCDGHGKQGEKISQFVIDYLNKHISSIDFTKDKANISSSLINLFKSCQNELINDKTISRKQSGTTVTCAFIINNKVIFTNIGDSRCVVFDKRQHKFIFETKAHTLSVPSEKERILKCPNAEVTAIVDNESGKKIGPERIFTKGKNGPGIMMTRSIGDVEAHALGVTDEADVDEKELTEGEYAVIAASDGLWDKVSDEEVCGVVEKFYKSKDVKMIVEELSDIAERKWRDTDDVIDDITIGIVLLKVDSQNIRSKKDNYK